MDRQQLGNPRIKWLRNAAGVLALLGAVGILAVGLVWDEMLHIVTAVLLLVAAGIAWRWQLLGGAALMVISCPLIGFEVLAQLWDELLQPLWPLFLAMVPFGSGVLFVVSWQVSRSSPARVKRRNVVLVAGSSALVVSFACCLPLLIGAVAGYFWRPSALQELQGDGLQRITPRGGIYVTGIAWSPDSTEVALTWSLGGGVVTPEGYIYILGLSGEEPRVLSSTEIEAWLDNPAWSTSDQIAFVLTEGREEQEGIWLADASNGQEIEFLVEGRECTWAPDGERLAVVDRVSGREYAIFILNTRTGEEEEIYRVSSDNIIQSYGLSWSPLGDQLAFSLGIAEGIAESGAYIASTVDIYVLDLGTGESRRVTEGGINRFPSWSPDGTAIAFANGSDNLEQTLVVQNLVDGSVVRPFEAVGIAYAAWSPDGKRIAFEYGGHVYVLETEVALGFR